MRLYELHKKGKTTHDTDYDKLYHLTNANGFSLSIEQNKLSTLRNNYISTTYDPTLNGFIGGDHYFFKFVLDAQSLAKNYGVFDFDFHTTYSDGTTGSLNEREVGIETKEIEPLDEYVTGFVLLFDLFSQTAIQWLLRPHGNTKGFLDYSKSEAPPAIKTIQTIVSWGKPLWIGEEGKIPNQKEKQFLNDIWKLYKDGVDEYKGLEILSDKYEVVDFFKKRIDSETVKRRQKGPKLTDLFNNYFTSKPIRELKISEIKSVVAKGIDILGFGGNVKQMILGKAEEAGAFHPAIAPVEWSIVFRDLADGDFDEAVESIDFIADRNSYSIERFDNEDPMTIAGIHTGTSFG